MQRNPGGYGSSAGGNGAGGYGSSAGGYSSHQSGPGGYQGGYQSGGQQNQHVGVSRSHYTTFGNPPSHYHQNHHTAHTDVVYESPCCNIL